MDWTNNIIKAEHSSYELLFLRTILAEHGDIVTFLPCKDTRQCFVRYSTSQGAESAYNNQNSVQGLRVSTVSQDPTLLNQYLTWHSSRFVEDYSKKWCVPKQEQKAPSGPKKRAYSEVETQKNEDSMPETKQIKREETAPRRSAPDQRAAFTPMTSERAHTKTQVKAAPAKGISRAEPPTPSYRKSQIRSKETSPPGASTRQSILKSPYSPKTKIAHPKRLARAEESTLPSACRKLRPKADRSQGLHSDRSVPLKETRASSKQSLAASPSPSKTGRAVPGEMRRAEALTPPSSCRKPQSKKGSLHGVNHELSVPKETSESELATRTYSPLSNTVTEDPVILNHERSEKQPNVHREDAVETSIVAIPSSFSMETKIELKVAGEKFMYDLRKLEDDPKAIIGLLKLASAERGHWMIVAAFYRRRGNAQAATKLMKELLEGPRFLAFAFFAEQLYSPETPRGARRQHETGVFDAFGLRG